MAVETKERIIKAALRLFAEKGVMGTSVRAIASEADVAINMITHYFGSKEGLLTEVLSTLDNQPYQVPIRIISAPARDKDDFLVRLRLFFRETLEAQLAHRSVMKICYHICEFYPNAANAQMMQPMIEYQQKFTAFLESAKKIGVVRKEADLNMIGAFLWDRAIAHVIHAEMIKAMFEEADIFSPKYRDQWVEANLDIFCNGIINSKHQYLKQ